MGSKPRVWNAKAAGSFAARLDVLRGVALGPFLRNRGYRFGRRARFAGDPERVWRQPDAPTRLSAYVEGHATGRGLWKWRHHLDVYERHLAKFVGADVQVLEIGIYGGGGLEMWREYFGSRCQIYGVDIAEACMAYEGDRIAITIGDQADPDFWTEFLRNRQVDVVIDDGGHEVDQQVTTLEAVLPRLSPGGVYICEDIGGVRNPFHGYLDGLSRNLDAWNAPNSLEPRTIPTEFQRMIASIHRYPYIVVIERSANPPEEFIAERHGTEWPPF